MKRKLSRFGKGEGLQIVHEAGEQPGLIQCVIDMFGRGLIHAVHDSFQVALNDMQRCAEFMGDIGGEVAALLFGTFEFADHFVEAFEQVAEYVGVVFRHTCRKIAFFDRVDGIEEFFEWFAEAHIKLKSRKNEQNHQNNWRAAESSQMF